MNILIRNLSRSVTEKDLLEMFQKFGKIKSFNIVLDQKTGQSKGFGFVDMPEKSEAIAAIRALNGQLIRGERIRVKSSVRSGPAPNEQRLEGDRRAHPQPRGIKGPAKERSSGRPAERFSGRSTGRSDKRSSGRPKR